MSSLEGDCNCIDVLNYTEFCKEVTKIRCIFLRLLGAAHDAFSTHRAIHRIICEKSVLKYILLVTIKTKYIV